MDVTAKKASNTLNFLQRCNLEYCPKQVKQTAYFSLVRYTGQGQARESQIIGVQNDYDQHSSFTAILKNLDWPSFERTPSTKQSDLNV